MADTTTDSVVLSKGDGSLTDPVLPGSDYPQLKLFILLALLGLIAAHINVQIPNTEALIDGRWVFGFIGFALFTHWWMALALAALLSYPYASDISLLFGFTGNMLYAVPCLIVIRTLFQRVLADWKSFFVFGTVWAVTVLVCYQAFITPAVWAMVGWLHHDPILPHMWEGWQTQPLLVESVLVAIVSATSMVAFLSIHALRQNERILKLSQKSLRETNELLGEAQRIAAIGSWSYNYDTQTLHWSDEVFRIYGLDPQQGVPTYQEFRNLIPLDQRKQMNGAVQSALGERKGYYLETPIVRPDGTERFICQRCELVCDEQNPTGLLVGTTQDITERRQAEQALRDNERYLNTILRTTMDGFWVVDSQGRFIDVNQAYCDMSGYTRDEIVGKHINDIDVNESPEETRARIERIRVNGSELFEVVHRRKDGSGVPLEVSSTLLPAEGNRYVCFCRDLTRRRQQEERITLLGQMLDNAPASVTVHDLEGNFIYSNNKTFEIHGYSESEFMAIKLRDLDTPESAALLDERFRLINQQGEASFEVAHYRKDGSTFPLQVLAKLIQWQGQPAILSVAADITERKELQQQQERQLLFSQALNEISESIISSEEPTTILETSNQVIGKTLHADRILIYDVCFKDNRANSLCGGCPSGYHFIQAGILVAGNVSRCLGIHAGESQACYQFNRCC